MITHFKMAGDHNVDVLTDLGHTVVCSSWNLSTWQTRAGQDGRSGLVMSDMSDVTPGQVSPQDHQR